jgi:hypothetical protein
MSDQNSIAPSAATTNDQVQAPKPEQTLAATSTSVAEDGDAARDHRIAVHATPGTGSQEQWAFLLNEQRYLLESARFADQKAAFAVAFSLGSLAFLHQQHVFLGAYQAPLSWIPQHVAGTLAGALLVFSCGVLMLAVLPRLWWSSEHELNLVFWEDVRQIGSPVQYFEAIQRAAPETLHREISDHCYTLAGICERKFSLIRLGMWVGAAGAILGLLALR